MMGRGTPTNIQVCFPQEHFIDFGRNYYQIKNTDPNYDTHKSTSVKIQVNNNTYEVPNLLKAT